jgi:hypothetical protein
VKRFEPTAGFHAHPSVHLPRPSLKDNDRQVREAAGAALKEIDPEAAKKAGVP